MIDGLRQPEYCGGIAEVAKGLWMRRQDLQLDNLLAYASRLRVGAVVRRLGFLLELYGMASTAELAKLQESLTATYAPLDPTLPRRGRYLSHWQLQLNIEPETLKNVRTLE